MAQPSFPRVSTRLDWLDRILGGGLPAQSLVVLAGAPGSCKSILAFHLLGPSGPGQRQRHAGHHHPSARVQDAGLIQRAEFPGANGSLRPTRRPGIRH